MTQSQSQSQSLSSKSQSQMQAISENMLGRTPSYEDTGFVLAEPPASSTGAPPSLGRLVVPYDAELTDRDFEVLVEQTGDDVAVASLRHYQAINRTTPEVTSYLYGDEIEISVDEKDFILEI